MANLDDNGAAGGGDSRPEERSTPTQLELRVHRLEAENQKLRDELDHLTQLRAHELKELHAHRMRGMPATAAEFERMRAKSVDMGTVIAEIVAELEKGK